MSNLICKNCKSVAVEYEDYCGGTQYYRCKTCGQRGSKDKFTQLTIFGQITQSPEMLAKELITTTYDEYKDCNVYWAWLGNGRREAYYAKAEAIAATVAKLKEVAGRGSAK